MRAVFLASIGPVQDFIASARRCGDLWYGSWLLSELAKAAALGISNAVDDAGIDDVLVFPGATSRASLAPGSDASVANKILARVPAAIAREAAEAGRRSLHDRLEELARAAFEQVGRRDAAATTQRFDEALAWEQVRELVEYLWVAVPEADGADGYADARATAERLLDARKQTKVWGQPTWASASPKSSLDGVRESVLDESLFGGAADGAVAEQLVELYGVASSERLCGVGILKRFGRREFGGDDGTERPRFFSTPHVAALPVMVRCKDAKPAFDRYADALRGAFGRAAERVLRGAPESRATFGCADGLILFDERLPEIARESAALGAVDAGLPDATAALAQFFRDTGAQRPSPYYAVLLADGDHMGRAISSARTFARHRSISLALAEFAEHARTIVADHDGSLVYAGGDDVLALVPLHTALACADALRRDFAERLAAFDGGGAAPTLSVGIGISHHIETMGEALAVARRAERLAKQQLPAKNALAVILDKRGGTPVGVAGPWDRDGDSLPARLHALVAMLRADALPDGVAHELAQLGATLEGADPRLIEAQTRRILARKRPDHGESPGVDAQHLAQIEGWGMASPSRLASEVLVARIFADAADLAEGPIVARSRPRTEAVV